MRQNVESKIYGQNKYTDNRNKLHFITIKKTQSGSKLLHAGSSSTLVA